jgi:hypothetical protein
MSTRRERQQLAQRSRRARRRGKPPQPSPKPAPQEHPPEPLWPPEDLLIGYIAHEGDEVLCHDGAPWIAGDHRQMERNLEQRGRTGMIIRPATFEDLAVALMEGVPLCFDECALARFYEPAQQAGIPMEKLAGRLDAREGDDSGKPALRLQLEFGRR